LLVDHGLPLARRAVIFPALFLTAVMMPTSPTCLCVPILFDDTRLQFLALNSAWEIDEYHRAFEHQPERWLLAC
jgi:hypothetical protein